jgi:hypothetical protein
MPSTVVSYLCEEHTMKDNLDATVGGFSSRSFRQDAAETSCDKANHAHSQLAFLDGIKEIMLEDEPERFVNYCE